MKNPAGSKSRSFDEEFYEEEISKERIQAQADLVEEIMLTPTQGLMDNGDLFVMQRPMVEVFKRVLTAAGRDYSKVEAKANEKVGVPPEGRH